MNKDTSKSKKSDKKQVHNKTLELKHKEEKDGEFTREITDIHTPPSGSNSPGKKKKLNVGSESSKKSKS